MRSLFEFILTILCTAASFAALLGAKKCTLGPSYWCHDLRNARECRAVEHCIQTVWSRQVLPKDNDDVCTICKEMVKEARDQLQSNETEEELKEVMEGSCNLIPVKIIDEKCIKLVDEFIPELIDMLTSQMQPQAVCATAGLCNSQIIDKVMLLPGMRKKDVYNKKAPFSVQLTLKRRCKDCVKYMSKFEDVIKSPNRVEEYFMELCGRTGSFSDSCRSLAVTYSTEILGVLNTFDARQFCKFSTFCADVATKTVPPALMYNSSKDTECDFCNAIVKHWVDILTYNTTKEEFKEMFLMICAQTGKFAEECKSLVLQYYEVMYDTLVNDIDPNEICKLVGLCGAIKVPKQIWYLSLSQEKAVSKKSGHFNRISLTKATDESQEHPLQKYLASIKKPLIGGDEAKSYSKVQKVDLMQGSRLSAAGIGSGSSTACVVCQYVLHELQNYVTSNSTEAEIKEEVEKICEKLPKNFVDECENLIDGYGDQVIAMLVQKIDPSVICPAIHVCPSILTVEKGSCAICTMVIEQLFAIVDPSKAAEDIRDALDLVCDLLPKDVSHQCQEIVNTYAEMIIESFLANLTPKEICHLIALCSAAPPPSLLNDIVTKPPGTPMHPDTELYEVDILQSDVWEDRQHPLSEVLSGSRNTVKHPLSKILSGSEEAVTIQPSPEIYMPELNAEMVAQHPLSEVLYGSPLAYYDAKCTVCETIMEELNQLVNANSSRAEILTLMNDICNKVPGTLGEECHGVVKAYGPIIIDFLQIELSKPVQICKDLNLCLSSMIQSRLDNVNVGKCDACRLIVDNLRNLLDDENVEDDIEQKVEKLCDFVPSSFREQCHTIIQEYGAYAVSILADNIDSTTVCSDLKMCLVQPKVFLLP